MNELKRPSISEVNLLYLTLGFVLLFIGYIVQSREVYSGLLITEYIIILLPNLLYLKLKGYSLKNVLKLRKISLIQIFYIILITIFAYPVAIFLNLTVITIISNISNVVPNTVPIPTNGTEYILGMFVIALAPGICEEVMFRGTIMKAYDRVGYKKSIVISAVLFGIFHFNIMNLIGPIFLGIVLGVLVHKTNSIFSSILAHTLNNGIALTIGFGLIKYSSQIDEMASSNPTLPESTQMLISLVFFGILALGSLSILVLLLNKMPVSERSLEMFELSEYNHKEKNGTFKYIPLLIIFATFIFLNYRILFFTV